MEKRFLDIEDVSSYLNLSKPTIRAWVRLGKIPYTKFGRAVRFDLHRLDNWARSKNVEARRDFHLQP